MSPGNILEIIPADLLDTLLYQEQHLACKSITGFLLETLHNQCHVQSNRSWE